MAPYDGSADAIAPWLAAALDCQRAGDLAAADAAYATLAARYPGQPDAAFHRGLLLLRLGRAKEAAASLAVAHAGRPDDVAVARYLARALLSSGDAGGAVLAADAALARAPTDAQAWFLRGTALSALGRPCRAEAALRRACTLAPTDAQSWLNLGNALADLDRLDDAQQAILHALALAPDLAEAEASLAFVLTSLGRCADAVAACDRAIARHPGFVRAHWNRGIAQLLAGDWSAGWDGYEWRFRNDPAWRGAPRLPGPAWDGGPLAGRRLLVLAEQGFGDTLQFARYLPLLAACGATVTLACDPRLHRLLSGLAPCVQSSGDPHHLPGHDLWVDQMSLPRLFATTPDRVPAASGYLAPGWARPPTAARPRVGLVWAGNPAHHNDRRRSLPRACLALLAALPVDWTSLQLGPRAAEAADLGATAFAAADFADTAAAVRSLDAVITVDSAVAHLAGALGCPTLVLLPSAPDWRWMLGRADTPWYDSLRLLRQDAPGDWQGVLARLPHALAGLLRPSPAGPPA